MATLGRWSGGSATHPTESWASPNGLGTTQDRNDGSAYSWSSTSARLTLPSTGLADGYLVLAKLHYTTTHNNRHTHNGRFTLNSGTGNFLSSTTGGYSRNNANNENFVLTWAVYDNPGASDTIDYEWKRDTGDGTTAGSVTSFVVEVIPLYYSDIGLYSSTSTSLLGGTTPNTLPLTTTVLEGTNITRSGNVISVTGDNKRYLILGSNYTEGRSGRTQRWIGGEYDSTQDRGAMACIYHRDSGTDENGIAFADIIETVTATRTIEQFVYRGDGISNNQGGADIDGNTPSVGAHAMAVIELNDSAEVFRSSNSGATAQNIDQGEATNVDISAVNTVDFNDSGSFTKASATAINAEQAMDFLGGANLGAASRTVSSGTRYTGRARLTLNGTEDNSTFHGNYGRGAQSSTDTFGYSANPMGFMSVSLNDDIGVSANEIGDAGDFTVQAGWAGFWGINLDTLEDTGQTLSNDFISSSNTVYEPTVSVSTAQQLDVDFISSSNTTYEPFAWRAAAFRVQWLDDEDVSSSGGNVAISSVDTSKAVALVMNNTMTSAGASGTSTYVNNDELVLAADLTSSTNVNFVRSTNALLGTRTTVAIWEYIGAAGGPNEFKVRARGNVSLNNVTRTTTATCDTTPDDIDKCVVFVTGYINDGGTTHESSTGIAWLSGSNTINFERGGDTQTTTFYYTVVEFTGSNWTVHHGHSGDVTGDTGSITLYDSQKGTGTTSTVTAWTDAFIYGLFKGDDTANNWAVTDLWPVYDPGTGTGTVDWTFDSSHDATDNQHLVYVIENSDTSFSVARYNTGAITLPTNDQTTTITSVTSINEALCFNTVEGNATGLSQPRGHRNSGFNSKTEVYSWCAWDGAQTGQIEYQVIDFAGMVDTGSQQITADYISSSYTVYEPTVSPGAVTLSADFIASSYTVYEPTLTSVVTLSNDFIAATSTTYEPTLTPGAATLTADFISSNYQVFEPTLTPGAITLTSDYISTSYQIFEPTLASVTQLDVDFIASGNQVFEPTVTPGAVTLSADYIVTSYQIFEPTLDPGAVSIASDFIASSYQTFEPTLTPGAVTVSNDFIASSYQIFEPTVNLLAAGQILADFIPSSYQIFEPTVSTVAALQINSDFIASTNVTYEPTLTPGPVTLTVDYINTNYQVFEPTLGSTFELGVDFIGSTYQVFEPLVTTPVPQTLNGDFISSSYQIFEPGVSTPSLEVDHATDDDKEKRERSDRAVKAVELCFNEYRRLKKQRILAALEILNEQLNRAA